MSLVAVNVELDALNRALPEYARLAGKTPRFVLAKQGGKISFALGRRLRALRPAKGSVRAERLAILAQGGGVKVRESARDFATTKTRATAVDIRTRRDSNFREVNRKGNVKTGARSWWEIAVTRELAIRESAGGFLGVSARYPAGFAQLETSQAEITSVSRYGPALSTAGLNAPADTLTFAWDGDRNQLAENAAAGLSRPKANAAVALALRDVTADIRLYTERKLAENKRQAGLA